MVGCLPTCYMLTQILINKPTLNLFRSVILPESIVQACLFCSLFFFSLKGSNTEKADM